MVNKYGADASRIALADAGDGVADANFEEDVTDNNVLRLFTLKEWCEEQISEQSNLRAGEKNAFLDRLFENEMNAIVHESYQHYELTDYKLALTSVLYDFTCARDFYREACIAAGIKMHRDLILRYIELQALLLAIIAPHWSEYIWLEVLKKPSTIQYALWPVLPEPIASLTAEPEEVDHLLRSEVSCLAGEVIDLVWAALDEKTMTINDKEIMPKISNVDMEKAMPFVQALKKRLLAGEKPSTVFERKLAFNEVETLVAMVPGLKKAAGLKIVEILEVAEGGGGGKLAGGGEVTALPPNAETAVPGVPTFNFENVK